jgi:DnaJ-class molecular chaperone
MTNTLPRNTRECEACGGSGEIHYGTACPDARGNFDVALSCDACDGHGTIYRCPNCGEDGGTPITVTYREFQGDAAHGGMVNHEDEACSKCIAEVTA